MKSYDFETVVLRFRDLATGIGETIDNHKNVIKNDSKRPYVWWAWWNKGGESIPQGEFMYLNSLAERNELDLFLLDSGRNKLYKAHCTQISWDHQVEKRVPSPEKDNTPDYYNTKDYLSWFKFTSIEECANDLLESYSYVKVDPLFEEHLSRYDRFYGKGIYDSQEMIQQNRTIWFIRKKKPTDPNYRVVLLDANFFEPLNFSKKIIQINSNIILWLSDTHLSENIFPEKDSVSKKSLWANIKRIMPDSKTNEFGALLISGDITSFASKDGFDKATSFIGDINRDLRNQLSSENILFCPGNHDFEFSKDDPKIIKLFESSALNFSEFYKNIHKIAPNQFFASGRKFVLSNGITLEIVALNSLMLQQFSKFEGQGFLSDEQLEFVAAQMGWRPEEKTGTIRMAMMHHHYLPAYFQDDINVNRASSVVYDAEKLIRWMQQYNIKFLLHGHKHVRFYSQVYHPKNMDEKNLDSSALYKLNIIGMGSTGSKQIPDGQPNMFATITFEPDHIYFDFYKIDDQSSDKRIQRIDVTDF